MKQSEALASLASVVLMYIHYRKPVSILTPQVNERSQGTAVIEFTVLILHRKSELNPEPGTAVHICQNTTQEDEAGGGS